MIFVGGLPFSTDSSSFSSQVPTSVTSCILFDHHNFNFSNFIFHEQGIEILVTLMKNPILESAARSFSSIEETKVSCSETSAPNKYVYLFQGEYATVDPSLVHVCFPFILY